MDAGGFRAGWRVALQRQAVVEEEVENGEVEDAVGVAFGGGEVVGEDDAGEVIVEEALVWPEWLCAGAWREACAPILTVRGGRGRLASFLA